MIINNVNLHDIDVADALEMERYEKANDTVVEKMKQLDTHGKRRSELIRAQCTAVFEFFDEIFGDGTAKKVFGDSVNLTTCINAYSDVITAVNKLDKNLSEQYKTKLGNRQQRRDKNKKKHYNNRPKPVK
nr:MAG TPA: tail assembly chaperone protein [Caudoviricetes sp.]